MRGNNFLPIDFGKRQKTILSPNKNNRRVIHYSYNLVNNSSTEEELAKKDSSVGQQLLHNSSSSLVKSHGTSIGNQYDVYGRPLLAKRQGSERKLSLQSNKNATSQRNGLQGITDSKKISENHTTSSLSRERKTSLNYSRQTAINRSQKADQKDFEKHNGNRNERSTRYSDPLYEQRSLPPLPYKNTNSSEGSTHDGASAGSLLSQFSKSQNNLMTSGAFPRKDGISAVENQDIMHAKMRKKGVCDQTDDSHYQRQFLRVLNKRF